MHQYTIAARSKLANFAQVISWCAERGVLGVRNANIVFGGTAEELGIRSSCLGKRQSRAVNFELGIILGFACDFELFSCELQQTVQSCYVFIRYSPAMYHPPMFASIVTIIILMIFHACCLCTLLLS